MLLFHDEFLAFSFVEDEITFCGIFNKQAINFRRVNFVQKITGVHL